MEIKLINCTPHKINIIKPSGTNETLEPSGILPRLKETTDGAPNMIVSGVPVTNQYLQGVENLPEPKPETYLIVSKLVAQAAGTRSDLLVPATVRDSTGKIIGCNGFYRTKL